MPVGVVWARNVPKRDGAVEGRELWSGLVSSTVASPRVVRTAQVLRTTTTAAQRLLEHHHHYHHNPAAEALSMAEHSWTAQNTSSLH